jgi:hypothetical protein
MDPSADSVWQLTGPIPLQPAPDALALCIHTSGRRFHVTFELASGFMRRVHELIEDDRGELVPLLHQDGFDMLYVAPNSPLEIHDLRDECPS